MSAHHKASKRKRVPAGKGKGSGDRNDDSDTGTKQGHLDQRFEEQYQRFTDEFMKLKAKVLRLLLEAKAMPLS